MVGNKILLYCKLKHRWETSIAVEYLANPHRDTGQGLPGSIPGGGYEINDRQELGY